MKIKNDTDRSQTFLRRLITFCAERAGTNTAKIKTISFDEQVGIATSASVDRERGEIKVWIGSESADPVHGMVLQITLAVATMLGEDGETSRSVARSAVDLFQDNRSSYITLWTPKVKAGPREALSAHRAIEQATAKEQHLLRSVRDLGRLAKKVDQLKDALAEAERLAKSLKSAQKEYDSCLASFLDGAKGLA